MQSANAMIMGGLNGGTGIENSSAAKLDTVLNSAPTNVIYQTPHVEQYIRENRKTQRNEPCPCGSGKKFKKCCIGKGLYD